MRESKVETKTAKLMRESKVKTKMEGTCQQPKKIGKIVSSTSKDHIK